jgi:translation elongation factor EF-Tu-like GTPase
MCIVPERKVDAPMRVPISGAYKIKGVGDVLAGRVEQGVVKPGDEVIFLPTHTTANPCIGKVRLNAFARECAFNLPLLGISEQGWVAGTFP